ncbi:MAG: arginase [Firmicutes bacterium HGW-Firmicutes-14]|nr:MAG: arginase [Firmicutes bacterium HGW-Firmicutes-14]
MNRIDIIGVPVDLGANRRGTDMGPSAMRYAGLRKALLDMGLEVTDHGNIEVPVPESIKVANPHFLFLEEILEVCEELGDRVFEVLERGGFPLVLGGDHSIAIGTLAGVCRSAGDPGLIWFDTHGDFNTFETSETGNIHGMSLAAVTGRGHPDLVQLGGRAPKVREEKTVLIGVRDLDNKEKSMLGESKITVFSMKKIDELGMARVIKEALLKAGGGGGIHVSFDLDVIDPAIASGVGTPVTGGLSYREAHLALELIAETKMLRSLEVCEVNPIVDIGGNRTARLAVELVTSALGKRIFY